MGMVAPVAELMLLENAYRPLGGDALFIGRQDIFLTPAALGHLLHKYRVPPRSGAFIEHGTTKRELITDKSFMSCFDLRSLSFMDVSDYEGADIIWDLGHPVESRLHNRFDLIFNGSCLDNMFNPAGAMMSITKMLRPGGRVVHLEHATSFNGPYLMFPPGWFFDYYVQNGFADCRVYVGEFSNLMDLFFGPWRLYAHDWECDPNGVIPSDGRHYMVVVVAEKKDDSTADKLPIQAQYRRNPQAADEFQRNVRTVLASPRPTFGITGRRNPGRRPLIDLGLICHDLYHGVYPSLG